MNTLTGKASIGHHLRDPVQKYIQQMQAFHKTMTNDSHSQDSSRGIDGEKTMTKKPMNDEEFMRQYTRDKYVSVGVVRAGGNVGVIIDGCADQYKEFIDPQTNVKTQKPYIHVQIKGDDYEYSLNRKQAAQLMQELGPNRAKWVGQKLKFEVDKAGTNEYVRCTVIPKD